MNKRKRNRFRKGDSVKVTKNGKVIFDEVAKENLLVETNQVVN